MLNAEIEKINSQINKMDILISNHDVVEIQQEYNVVPVTIKNQLYVYKYYEGNYNGMSEDVNFLYSLAKERVKGELFLLDNFTNDDINCQICLPVSEKMNELDIRNGHFKNQEGLQVTHYGSYNTIGKAYKILIDYAGENNRCRNGQFLTRFLTGSGKLFKGNVNKYKTDVILLLDNEEKMNEA